MQVQLVLRSKKGRQVFRLKKKVSVLGRAQGCTVRIPSADVSREHCRIKIKGERVTVEDLGSANGTLLNGVVLDEIKEMHAGDFLRVGPALFVIEVDASKTAREPDFEVVEDEAEFEVVEDDDDDRLTLEADDDPPPPDRPVPLVGDEDPFSFAPPDGEPEAAPDASQSAAWHMPEGGDIRDILSQLDAPAEPEPPKKKKKKKE
jgi:pSer/pThr/pTyr-binding forkhead associated (FHA) protein